MRKTLTVVAGTVVVLAGIAALLAVLQARDEGDIGGEPSGPGQVQPDRGARHGSSAPEVSAEDLPASGEHAPAAAPRDQAELTGDEWLHALELGNVIIAYGSEEPGEALLRLQDDLTGPYDPELAAAGQSLILAHVDGLAEPTAVAWRRTLKFQDPAAPEVREFVEAWLGTGAPR